MEKKILLLLILAIGLAITIPIVLYITYPAEEDIVEQVMEEVYENPPYPLPRFVPGVIGYGSSVEREFVYRGVFSANEKGFNIVAIDRGERVPVVLLHRYLCSGNTSSPLPREALLSRLNNRAVVVKGIIFRTPKGVVLIPLEIRFNNISCVYLRR